MSLFNAQTFNARAFKAKFFVRTGGAPPPVVVVTPPFSGAGQGLSGDYEARVRYWNDLIDDIDERKRRSKKQLEAKKAELAKLESVRRKDAATSARAERRAKLAAQIQLLETQQLQAMALFDAEIAQLLAQIEAARAAMISRRNLALALILTMQ